MDLDQVALVKNNSKSRFEMLIDKHYAFIMYEMLDEHSINLYHTEVDSALEGKGVGRLLVLKTLEYCKLHHLKVLPSCPFIAKFILRHPEWQEIVIGRKAYDED